MSEYSWCWDWSSTVQTPTPQYKTLLQLLTVIQMMKKLVAVPKIHQSPQKSTNGPYSEADQHFLFQFFLDMQTEIFWISFSIPNILLVVISDPQFTAKFTSIRHTHLKRMIQDHTKGNFVFFNSFSWQSTCQHFRPLLQKWLKLLKQKLCN